MNRLRNRLILIFLAATIAPLGVAVWVSAMLLDYSLGYAARGERELDTMSRSLERTGRELYRHMREGLERDAQTGKIPETSYRRADQGSWPKEIASFWEGGEPETFHLAGEEGNRLEYWLRRPDRVSVFARDLGVGMNALSSQYSRARETVQAGRLFDRRRGFFLTFIVIGVAIWSVSFGILIVVALRLSRPIQQLTAGLTQLATGNLAVRVTPDRNDEVGRALQAFNDTAAQLEQSRDRLVYLTQLASWQSLARKMAHEVKNSLTPIRLMVEEIAARHAPVDAADRAFLEQGRQIIVEEIESLERRIRAFSEFSAEPPVRPAAVAVNPLVEERVALLRNGHPEVDYRLQLAAEQLAAWADEDLVKGVLTNLLVNAAEAAGAGGSVLALTQPAESRIAIEVHDSGPGLPAAVKKALFQPTISFKKHGAGLGLSIAKKSALLVGGDLVPVPGLLGGAGFRVLLPVYETNPDR